ncbi:hypothetical protein [Nocardia salmonicida]
MATSVDGTAPSSVAAGAAVAITLAAGPSTVPSSASGFTVTTISNLKTTSLAPTDSTPV